MQQRRGGDFALLFALLAFLGVFLLWPIWLTVEQAFSGPGGDDVTLYHLRAVFASPHLVKGLLNAFLIGLCTTVLCMVIALPLAVIAARCDFRGKTLLSGLVLLPLILPPFVGAIGVAHLLGRAGAVNTLLLEMGVISEAIDFIGAGGFWAIVVVEALHLFPIIYLNAAAALANLDPALEEAAENLGASRLRRLRTVVIPLIRPGLFAGATIVFIWSFTELGTPLMFEYHEVTPVQIFNRIVEMNSNAEPYALTVVMLLAAVLLYVSGKLAFGRRAFALYSRPSTQADLRRLRPFAGAAVAMLFAVPIALATLPHLGVILVSVSEPGMWYHSILPQWLTAQHYDAALSHPLAVGSIRNSLLLASAAVGVNLLLGMAIAHLVVRTRTPGRHLLDTLAMLPLAVPGLVLAFGYVAMTLSWPFGGMLPDPLAGALGAILPSGVFNWLNDAPLHGWIDVLGADPNPFPLLIIAYAVRRLPYVVRAAAAGLEQTPVELEEASLNLGASRLSTLRRITVPLIAANLIAGGLLAFSFSVLEVSDSLILALREEHFPITKAIYVLFQRLGDGPYIASAMGVWGMALLALSLIGATLLMGRRMGAIFRV